MKRLKLLYLLPALLLIVSNSCYTKKNCSCKKIEITKNRIKSNDSSFDDTLEVIAVVNNSRFKPVIYKPHIYIHQEIGTFAASSTTISPRAPPV